MKVIRVAFEFLVGLLAVIMVMVAIVMIAYIIKVTTIEIFGEKKWKEWFDAKESITGKEKNDL